MINRKVFFSLEWKRKMLARAADVFGGADSPKPEFFSYLERIK